MNGPRFGKDVPISDIDPISLMESMRAESRKKAQTAHPSMREQSEARKKELREKMDRQHYKEYHQKQNQKK